MAKTAEGKKALLGASVMCHIAWETIKATALQKNEEAVAAFEDQIQSGDSTLAIFIQRDATHVFLTAAALPKGWDDPFDGGGLVKIQGPIVESLEELQRLFVVDRNEMN